jgi:GNAT superfamily N-acetyltransferase
MSAKQKPSRSLPANASEEFLRKEAKRLAKERGVSLGIAQLTLAHEYGHRNWPDLVAAANTVLHAPSAATRAGASLRDEEWSAITSLAETSLAEMPMAPSVKEWLDNRKSFSASGGVQQQFVATSSGRIVGYACAEHPPVWMRNSDSAAGQYRLFMVVEPASRTTLGSRLLERLRELLIDVKARRAWFQEYEADTGLILFLEGRGFARASTFQIEDGTRIVRLYMDAPFEPLTHRASTDSPAGDLHEEGSR